MTEANPTAREAVPAWRRVDVRSYGIIVSFLALFAALSLASDKFLTPRNLLNVLDQSAPVGIIACGVTLGIIAGVFDLSVGAIFAVAAVVACKVALVGNPWLGIAVGMLSGGVLGLLNAFLVNRVRINSFIATLASSIVFRGIAIAMGLCLAFFVIDVTSGYFADHGYLDPLMASWVPVFLFGPLAFSLSHRIGT